MQVITRTTSTQSVTVAAVTSAAELLEFQQLIRMVPVSDEVARHVVRLVRATRFKSEEAPEIIKRYVNYGASVRAAQFIVLAAKARALARGRYHVDFDDIDAYVVPVLRHRILLNFHAQSDRVEADEILRQMLAQIPRP